MQDVNNHLMQTDAEKRREMQTCALALFEFKSGPNLGCMSVPIGQSLHSYFRKICTNAVNRVELGRENTIDAVFFELLFWWLCAVWSVGIKSLMAPTYSLRCYFYRRNEPVAEHTSRDFSQPSFRNLGAILRFGSVLHVLRYRHGLLIVINLHWFFPWMNTSSQSWLMSPHLIWKFRWFVK